MINDSFERLYIITLDKSHDFGQRTLHGVKFSPVYCKPVGVRGGYNILTIVCPYQQFGYLHQKSNDSDV